VLADMDVRLREALAVEARLPRRLQASEHDELGRHDFGTGSARSNRTADRFAILRAGGRSSSTTDVRWNVAPIGGRCGSGIRARSSSVSVRSKERRWTYVPRLKKLGKSFQLMPFCQSISCLTLEFLPASSASE